MRCIEKIDILFAVCDVFSFEADYIGSCYIGKFRREIVRDADNTISELNYADSVAFEIFSEADKTYVPAFSDEPRTFFERIQEHKDIERIVLYFDDGTSQSYEVDYDACAHTIGSDNRNEKVYISGLGNLYVVIERGKEISDHFNLTTVNDETFMEYRKRAILGNDCIKKSF